MTPLQSIVAAPARPAAPAAAAVRCVMRVRWTSQPAAGVAHHRVFNLEISLIDDDRARVSAWIDRGDVRHLVLNGQILRAVVTADEAAINVDVIGDNGDGILAAITVLKDGRMTPSNRPLFARTRLLEKAGFAAGSHDPPTLEYLPATAIH